MRIAGFASLSGGSTQYRAYQPLEELARQGHEVLLNTDGLDADPRVLGFDVAYLQRHAGRNAERLARRLRDAGLAVVWDIDDDVLSSRLSRRGALDAQRTRAAVEGMIGVADMVTTTQELLAARYGELGAPCVRVLPNYLSRISNEVRAVPHQGVVVGWAAWIDHQEDWRRLGLESTVRRLLDEHPDVRVESVGPIDLGLPKDRYTRTGAVPFGELPQSIARFDVGIAPLANDAFNASRSDIKLKEYAIAGVPWLASPVGPYASLGERQGGRLVPDGSWHDELAALVTDARRRRRLAKRALKWARGQTLERNIDVWERTFAEAIERARSRR